MKHYHQVTDEERFYIWNASREGVSQKKIAQTLGRHPSTISREMKRNRMPRSVMYTHYWACEMVKWRKRRVADTKVSVRWTHLALRVGEKLRTVDTQHGSNSLTVLVQICEVNTCLLYTSPSPRD